MSRGPAGGRDGETSPRARFFAGLSFPPDPFQVQACAALDAGRSVLVSAPTGSGKTLVAAYAVARARHAGGRAFYTTPLKALSNQKYQELAAEHGAPQVGLLTGDTSLRPEAPVVVMTTEVLRNMLLADPGSLADLHTVVLDEVHYLEDPYRGGVWEEVLVLTPPGTTFVCLSATVSNATDLAAWLSSIRGPTDLVVERRRPVLLGHHVAFRRRGEDEPTLVDLVADGVPQRDALALDAAVEGARRLHPGSHDGWQARGRGSGRGGGGRGGGGRGGGASSGSSGRGAGRRSGHGGRWGGPPLPFRTPRRAEVVALLAERALLPAIVFIFSRAACGDAVHHCLEAGVRLTDGDQRRRIRAIAEHHVETISDRDLQTLGYDTWLTGLEAGVAPHHAGLVPAFREAVEECFARGLLQVVFATETLALGVNLPARSVVIERFAKYGAAGRATLTSGEYAQLTGRAGRRGLDEEGHAVVLWTPDPPIAEVAAVALAEPPQLRSSFRPTYNLAVNLVRRTDRRRAHEILRRSFAQWQADHSGQPGRRDRLTERLARRLAVLQELGYVSGWQLTDAGERLTRTYHECDLVVAEALASGALSGAGPTVLAGLLAAVVYEQRRGGRAPVGRGRGRGGGRPDRRDPVPANQRGPIPTTRRRRLPPAVVQELEERLSLLAAVAERVRAVEEVHRVPPTRPPDPALAQAVAIWAGGGELDSALAAMPPVAGAVAPGDFVRVLRQVADLAGQVATSAPDPALAEAARGAVARLTRDVAASVSPDRRGSTTAPSLAP